MIETQEKLFLPLVVTDPDCPLCVRFAQTLKRSSLDNKLCLATLTDLTVYQTYPELDPQSCHEKLHFLDTDRQVYTGAAALKKIAETLPETKGWVWLLETGMGAKALNFFEKKTKELRAKSKIKHPCRDCPTKFL